MEQTIEIRPLYALSEMHVAVELQKTYWGHDVESVIPAHMLYSLAKHGGHVLAALDGDKLVGVLVGFLGTYDEDSDRPAMTNLQIVSKRMVILPAYRNQGLAFRLKAAQRDLALKQAIRLITWTFDPLLAPNAYLNIRKLGAVTHEFHENYYGVDSYGGLSTLGASDRLVVEWWVTHRRVTERLEGRPRNLTLSQYLEADTLIINPTTAATDGTPWPSEYPLEPSHSMALVEIPPDFQGIVRSDEALAQAWRGHIRHMFRHMLVKGYVVTDFVRDVYEGRDRTFYLLSLISPQFDASFN